MSALTTTDSQLKEGYKQTEIGIIPNNWLIVTLGEVLSFQNGVNADKKAYGSGIPFINISEVIANSFLTVDQIPGRVSLSSQIAKSFKVEFGDVLFNRTSETLEEVGLASIYLDNADVVFGGFVIRGKPNKDHLDPIFCSYLLRSPNIHSQISSKGQGVVRANIGQKELSKVKIFIPSKSEQESIAHALSDIDALIESLDRLLTKKRQIKQGAMQELLRFKKGWVEKKLEDIADVIDPHPSHRAPAEVPNGIPFIGIGDIGENGEFIGSKVRTVDEKVFDEHQKRYNLDDELIGLGRVASIGKVVKIKKTAFKYVISPTLGVIRGTNVKRNYLLCALNSKAVTDQFARIMSGSTRSSVGMVVLRKLNIALPIEEAERDHISTILSDMDAEIDSIEAKLTKTRQIKQGMMHELLTGRIRLI
jgi:type I restriction enzyme, S subunit